MERFGSFQELLTANAVPESSPCMVTDNMSPGPAQPISKFTQGGQYAFSRQRIPGSTMFAVLATEVTKDANGKVAQGQPFNIQDQDTAKAMRFSTVQEAIAHIMSERNKMSNPFNKGQTITLNQQE